MRISLILSFFTAFLLLFPQIVSADSIRIEPAFVDVVLSEEDLEKTFDITITNNSDSPISIDLSSLDFKQSDDSRAGVGFLGKDIKDYSYALSSFLSFENKNLELLPREEREITVTVNNRQDLSPGGHYAAVIVSQRADAETKETKVTPALSSLVYLIKSGGERYNLSFKEVDFPNFPIVFSHPSTYFILLQNDGNVHLIPHGRADVTDLFGRLIFKGVINENSIKVLPQSRRSIPVLSKNVAFQLPLSINKLDIDGRDSLDKTKFFYQDYYLYVNPIFGGALIIGSIVFVWIVLRRKRRSKTKK